MAGLKLQVINLQTEESDVQTFETSSVRVGRHPLNELHLDFQFVSQWHGVFRFGGETCLYLDLGSTNGSYLNGRRLGTAEEVPVSANDELRIGWLRLAPEFEEVSAMRPAMVPVPPSIAPPRRKGPPSRLGTSPVPPPPMAPREPVAPPPPMAPREPVALRVPKVDPNQTDVDNVPGPSNLTMVLWRLVETFSPRTPIPRDEAEWEELLDRLGRALELLAGTVVEQGRHDERIDAALRIACPDERADAHERMQELLAYLLDVQAPPGARVRSLKQMLD